MVCHSGEYVTSVHFSQEVSHPQIGLEPVTRHVIQVVQFLIGSEPKIFQTGSLQLQSTICSWRINDGQPVSSPRLVFESSAPDPEPVASQLSQQIVSDPMAKLSKPPTP